jgi:hypothetical protein
LKAIGQDIVSQKNDVEIRVRRIVQQMVNLPVDIAFQFLPDSELLGTFAAFKKRVAVFNRNLFQAAEVIYSVKGVFQVSGMPVRGRYLQ